MYPLCSYRQPDDLRSPAIFLASDVLRYVYSGTLDVNAAGWIDALVGRSFLLSGMADKGQRSRQLMKMGDEYCWRLLEAEVLLADHRQFADDDLF